MTENRPLFKLDEPMLPTQESAEKFYSLITSRDKWTITSEERLNTILKMALIAVALDIENATNLFNTMSSHLSIPVTKDEIRQIEATLEKIWSIGEEN
jgi:hypothetical protein